MKRISSQAAGLVLLCGLLGCATADPDCQKQIDACLKRCEASGGSEVKVEHASPEVSTTWCEDRCQHCHESTPPAAPPSSSPPTYTGNAKP